MSQLIKFFITGGFGALICVSCAIPPTQAPQQTPVPVIPKRETTPVDKPITQPAPTPKALKKPSTRPTIQVPTPSSSTRPPPIRPTVPVLITPHEPVAQLPASLISLRNVTAVPGGVVWIALRSQSDTPPKVVYQQRRVVVLRDGPQWVALVGIPLTAKPGLHVVIDQDTGKHYSFNVSKKKYKTQHIRLKNQRHVNPNSKDIQRILRERQQITAAFATPWRATPNSPLPLRQPVKGRFSSPFGLHRYFNGQRRNRHTGLDIAAPAGTSIVAANEGKVIKIGNYFFTGKTVFIDHGQGVVSLYAHLNSITVSLGQTVNKGEKIGTVGKTGRATGPHLHWSVSLNKTLIDPRLVMQ